MKRLLVTRIANKKTVGIEASIDEFVKEPMTPGQRKALRKQIKSDMYDFLIAPEEYFLFEFEGKTPEEKAEFFGDLERIILLGRAFNAVPEATLFRNKTEAYERFKDFYKRDVIEVVSEEDFDDYIEFVTKHDKYMVKPSNSCGGEGICIERSPLDDEERRKVFGKLLQRGRCTIEEVIEQGEEMAALHPDSVNTIRITTYVDEGKTTIISSTIRAGRGSNVVDNGACGGLIAAVNPRTGIVITAGKTKKNESLAIHPDTGVKIEGFQVPHWDELLAFVDQLVDVVPAQKYVGWDLAYSDAKGWLMVEGNSGGRLMGAQFSTQKGLARVIGDTLGRV